MENLHNTQIGIIFSTLNTSDRCDTQLSGGCCCEMYQQGQRGWTERCCVQVCLVVCAVPPAAQHHPDQGVGGGIPCALSPSDDVEEVNNCKYFGVHTHTQTVLPVDLSNNPDLKFLLQTFIWKMMSLINFLTIPVVSSLSLGPKQNFNRYRFGALHSRSLSIFLSSNRVDHLLVLAVLFFCFDVLKRQTESSWHQQDQQTRTSRRLALSVGRREVDFLMEVLEDNNENRGWYLSLPNGFLDENNRLITLNSMGFPSLQQVCLKTDRLQHKGRNFCVCFFLQIFYVLGDYSWLWLYLQ